MQQSAAREEPSANEPDETQVLIAAARRRQRRRRRRLVVVVAVIVLVAGGIGAGTVLVIRSGSKTADVARSLVGRWQTASGQRWYFQVSAGNDHVAPAPASGTCVGGGVPVCYIVLHSNGVELDGKSEPGPAGFGPDKTVMFRSSDGGTHWAQVVLPADAWLSSAMSCSRPDTCAVGGAIVAPADVTAPPPPGTPAVLFTTRDGGRTWEHFPLPGPDTMITQLSCPTSTVCYAIALRSSGFDGYGEADHANQFWATDLLRTNDSGRTWTAATFPSGPPGDYDSLTTLDCPTTSTCYAGAIRAHLVFGTQFGEREYTIGSVTGLILESTDGGTNLRTATQTGSDTPDSISCPTLTVCYLTESDIAGTQLMATTNAGQSWTTTRPAAFSTPAFDYGIPDINCPTVNVCLASAPMGSNLLASTDRGRTWSPVPDAGYVFSASCTPRLSCVALQQDYHPYPGIASDANEIRPISLK